jgi:hypothetical protein
LRTLVTECSAFGRKANPSCEQITTPWLRVNAFAPPSQAQLALVDIAAQCAMLGIEE